MCWQTQNPTYETQNKQNKIKQPETNPAGQMESSEERVTHSIIFPFNNQWKCGPKKSVENRKRNHLLQKINIIPCFQRWIRGHTSTQTFMADFGSLWRRFFFRLLTTLIPSSIRKYSYTFSKNFQPNIWMITTSKHSWGSASVQYDGLKFRRCCPATLYRTALQKHPNVRKQVGRYRLSLGPWPRKQKIQTIWNSWRLLS